MNLNVTISIDDVHPQKGWRILGDQTETWLRSLNEEFGAKFTTFVPSNYHNEYPLSEHKEWVKDMLDIDWIEMAAHGHFHMTSDPEKYGECEFAELQTWREVDNRMGSIKHEWESCGIIPTGWKSPGWVCHPVLSDWIGSINMMTDNNWFKYVSLHYEHNRNLKWNCKTFFGHDGIQQTEIGVHNIDEEGNGMIMLTSHIAGDWNDNVWNEQNYQQLRLSLQHLVENHNCEFKTLNQCV